jgi:hypothetical protein
MRFILFAAYFALLVNSWRRYLNRSSKEDENQTSPARALHSWLLRPSNLLIFLGAVFYVYWCLNFEDRAPAPRLSFWISVVIVGLAFAIRRWEDETTRE